MAFWGGGFDVARFFFLLITFQHTSMNMELFESLLLKYPNATMRDLVLAQMSARLSALEIMLVERLFSDSSSREKALKQLDSDSAPLMEGMVALLASKSSGASGTIGDLGGDKGPSNN